MSGFLGSGWKFEGRLDEDGRGFRGLRLEQREVDGREHAVLALSDAEEDVREAIWIILSTAPGERLMHPDFGCGLHDYVFAPNDTHTAGMVRFHVERALERWEPRIELLVVTVEPDPGDPAVLLVGVDYRVRSTDSRFNLVYPFYLERGGQA